MPVKDLIQYDYKIFELNGKRCGVGTLETTNPEYGLGRKEEILQGLEALKIEQSLDFIMLSIVDILAEENTTITLDGFDSEIIEKVFTTSVSHSWKAS